MVAPPSPLPFSITRILNAGYGELNDSAPDCGCVAIVSMSASAFSIMFSSPTSSSQDDPTGEPEEMRRVLRAHASSAKQQPEELRDWQGNGERDQGD
jgi:hypothetical protein